MNLTCGACVYSEWKVGDSGRRLTRRAGKCRWTPPEFPKPIWVSRCLRGWEALGVHEYHWERSCIYFGDDASECPHFQRKAKK